MSSSVTFHLIFLEQGLLLWLTESARLAGQWAQGLYVSVCSVLGLKSFYETLVAKLGPSCLHNKHFTDWTNASSSNFNYFFRTPTNQETMKRSSCRGMTHPRCWHMLLGTKTKYLTKSNLQKDSFILAHSSKNSLYPGKDSMTAEMKGSLSHYTHSQEPFSLSSLWPWPENGAARV